MMMLSAYKNYIRHTHKDTHIYLHNITKRSAHVFINRDTSMIGRVETCAHIPTTINAFVFKLTNWSHSKIVGTTVALTLIDVQMCKM